MSLVSVRITFSMIAKCAISAAFAIAFLYAPEIFPTTLRFHSVLFLQTILYTYRCTGLSLHFSFIVVFCTLSLYFPAYQSDFDSTIIKKSLTICIKLCTHYIMFYGNESPLYGASSKFSCFCAIQFVY